MDADDVWGNAWNESPSKEQEAPAPVIQASLTPKWGTDDYDHPEADVGLGSSALEVDHSWSPAITKTNSFSDGWGTSLSTSIPAWGGSTSAIGGWNASDEPHHDSSIPPADEDDDEVDIGIAPRPPLPSAFHEPGSAPLEKTGDESGPATEPTDELPTTTSASPSPEDQVVSDSRQAEAFNIPKYVPPSSPDAFGTFEVGLEQDDHPSWSPQPSPMDFRADGDAGWGSAWSERQIGASTMDQNDDRWQSSTSPSAHPSRKQVPSYVIDNLLAEWQMFAREVLAEPASESDSSPQDSQDWEGGLDKVEGLNSLMNSFLPDISLPPTVPFSATKIATNLNAGLKSTRDLPITRASPLSHLYASKGSTSWITSIKNRSEPVVDDWAWMGGKPEEPAPEVAPTPATAEKKGGLLSFFGRRSASQASETARSTPEPIKSSPTPASGSKPASRPGTPKVPSPLAPSFPTGSETRKSDASKPSSPTVPTPPAPVAPFVPFDTPAPGSAATSDSGSSSQPSAAPSAVSRFFNRFSRSKSSSNPHQLALSSSDLAFLDEIPSMMDDDDEDELKALEGLLQSKPPPSRPILPSKLPMPLAPPPPPAKKSTPVVSASSGSSANNEAKDDDMWGIFEKPMQPSPAVKSLTAEAVPNLVGKLQSSRSSTPILPSVLAPPPKSTNSRSSSRSSTPIIPAPPTLSSHQRFNTVPKAGSLSSLSIGIPPPPRASSTTSSPLVPQPPPPANNSSLGDFDDFDDFMTAPSSIPPSVPPKIQTTPTIQAPTPLTATPSRNKPPNLTAAFGDFTSFDPPQSPLTSPRITAPDTNPLENPHHGPPRRSLSPLLTKAQTRTGTWPAPRSPVPQLLAPPPHIGVVDDPLDLLSQEVPAPSTPSVSPLPLAVGSILQPATSNQITPGSNMIPGAIQGNGVGPSSIIKGVIGNGLLPPPLPGPPSVAGLSNPRLPIPPLPQLNVSLPTIPQPPVGTIPSMSAFSIPVVSPPTLPTTSQSLFLPKTVVQSSPSPGPGGNSGQSNKLSASDLSFFEGL